MKHQLRRIPILQYIHDDTLEHAESLMAALTLADGSEKTFRRSGETPQVAIHDPLKAHRDLLSQYSDKDIHDVTAYLVTLK